MAIPKEKWEEIEKQLIGSYGTVEFSLDGHKLTASKKFIAENKLAIVVYIDNEIMPAWGMVSSDKFKPLVEKVWAKRAKSIYTPKKQKEIIKAFGKRGAKKHFPNLEEKVHWYECYFNTFSVFKRQYQKLEGLEVVAIGLEVLEKDLAEA